METPNDPFKKAIFKHLQELASQDDLFAKTFAKVNKNIDDCATYILNEVQKSGRQGFDNDEIYNMAIHYYDEDKIEIGKPLSARVVVNHALAQPVNKSQPSLKSVQKKGDVNQISLFNL